MGPTSPESARPGSSAPPPPTSEAIRASVWQRARTRYERVRDQWTDLVTDPLNAIGHSALFDTTQPRTAAFIDSYGQLTDLASVLGDQPPDDVATGDRFADLARITEQRWTEALDYSAAAVTYRWLPEAEQRHARQASALLATAADESTPLELRAESARKAGELLTRIVSDVLPRATVAAIATQDRLALEAHPDRPSR